MDLDTYDLPSNRGINLDDYYGLITGNKTLIEIAENWYATKKSIRHEILNVALFAANITNLKHLTAQKDQKDYKVPIGLTCIVFSLILQVTFDFVAYMSTLN